MSNSTLVSLAVLKANWDVRGFDYIDNFIPFAAECLRCSDQEYISAPQIVDDMRAKFGLRIPQAVVSTILKRMQREGMVEIEDGAAKPCLENLELNSFSETRDKAARSYELLITELIDFCSSRHNVNWSKEQAEHSLETYLSENEMLVECLRSDGYLPSYKTDDPRGIRYLIGSFVEYLYETHSSKVSDLETIVQGNMLAEAVFLPRPSEAGRKFSGTTIYLDTSICLFALGHGGPLRQAPCRDLIRLLLSAKARVCCFEHTLREMYGALEACAYRLDSRQTEDAYGASMEYFLDEGKTGSDVWTYVAQLETDLEKIGIHIQPKPDYGIYEHVIDESGLESYLNEHMGYHSDLALQRDTQSVAAIIRLRKGIAPITLERSTAVFVTSNSALAKNAALFMRHDENLNCISPCITDDMLATILWLKNPNLAVELPRKLLIANAFAAVNPDDELLRQYVAKIKQLKESGEITEDAASLLRYDRAARKCLMDLTKGDTAAFTNGTAQEILEVVRATIRATEKKRHDVEVEQLKADYAIREKELLDRLDKVEEESIQLRAEMARREEEEAVQKRNIQEMAERRAHRWAIAIRVAGGGLLFAVFLWLNIPSHIMDYFGVVPDLINIVIIVVMAILSLLAFWFGVTYRDIIGRLETYISRKIETRHLSSDI